MCGRFASFLCYPFFELRQQLVCKVGSIFEPQAGSRERVSVLLFKTVFQLGKSLGPKIWGPDLGPNSAAQIWAHLAMLFLVAGLRATACNSPNSYALPRGSRAGCGRDICLLDQSNSSNIFSTPFRDVNLAAAAVGGLRVEARNAWFFRPRKGGPQFQLRLPREADSPSAPVLCGQTTSGRAPLVVNICHVANMTALIHCLIP